MVYRKRKRPKVKPPPQRRYLFSNPILALNEADYLWWKGDRHAARSLMLAIIERTVKDVEE